MPGMDACYDDRFINFWERKTSLPRQKLIYLERKKRKTEKSHGLGTYTTKIILCENENGLFSDDFEG